MDAIKGLKYALVLVLIVSAALLTWTTYLERSQNHKIEAFSQAMKEAKTETQARQVVRSFLANSEIDLRATSASADDPSCEWLCE